MSRKHIATEAFIRLVTSMYLRMTFQVVSSNETFIAMVTLILSVTKMRLDVRLNVFLSSKASVAAGVNANPFPVNGIRSGNVRCDFINGNPSLGDGGLDAGIEV